MSRHTINNSSCRNSEHCVFIVQPRGQGKASSTHTSQNACSVSKNERCRLNMIAIRSCNHVVWPVTALATMLPIIVETCVANFLANCCMKRHQSGATLFANLLLRQVSWVPPPYVLFDRGLHPCYVVLDESGM